MFKEIKFYSTSPLKGGWCEDGETMSFIIRVIEIQPKIFEASIGYFDNFQMTLSKPIVIGNEFEYHVNKTLYVEEEHLLLNPNPLRAKSVQKVLEAVKSRLKEVGFDEDNF